MNEDDAFTVPSEASAGFDSPASGSFWSNFVNADVAGDEDDGFQSHTAPELLTQDGPPTALYNHEFHSPRSGTEQLYINPQELTIHEISSQRNHGLSILRAEHRPCHLDPSTDEWCGPTAHHIANLDVPEDRGSPHASFHSSILSAGSSEGEVFSVDMNSPNGGPVTGLLGSVTPIQPGASQIYINYAGLSPDEMFESSDAAIFHRKTRYTRDEPLEGDGSIAHIQCNQLYWVQRLYEAFIDSSMVQDNSQTPAYRRFVSGQKVHYAVKDITATCWKILDIVLDGAAQGFKKVVSTELERRIREQKGVECVDRLRSICMALRTEKTICVDVLEKGKKEILGLVYAPEAYMTMKKDYRRQNNGRGSKNQHRGAARRQQQREPNESQVRPRLRSRSQQQQHQAGEPSPRRPPQLPARGSTARAARSRRAQPIRNTNDNEGEMQNHVPAGSTSNSSASTATGAASGSAGASEDRPRASGSAPTGPDPGTKRKRGPATATEDGADEAGRASKMRRTGQEAVAPARSPLRRASAQLPNAALAAHPSPASSSSSMEEPNMPLGQHSPATGPCRSRAEAAASEDGSEGAAGNDALASLSPVHRGGGSGDEPGLIDATLVAALDGRGRALDLRNAGARINNNNAPGTAIVAAAAAAASDASLPPFAYRQARGLPDDTQAVYHRPLAQLDHGWAGSGDARGWRQGAGRAAGGGSTNAPSGPPAAAAPDWQPRPAWGTASESGWGGAVGPLGSVVPHGIMGEQWHQMTPFGRACESGGGGGSGSDAYAWSMTSAAAAAAAAAAGENGRLLQLQQLHPPRVRMQLGGAGSSIDGATIGDAAGADDGGSNRFLLANDNNTWLSPRAAMHTYSPYFDSSRGDFAEHYAQDPHLHAQPLYPMLEQPPALHYPISPAIASPAPPSSAPAPASSPLLE